MKICKLCKIEYNGSNFGKYAKLKDGLNTKCKKCYNEYRKRLIIANGGHKEIYKRNRKNVLMDRKKTYKKNRDKKLEYQNNYYRENRDIINQKRKSHKIKKDLHFRLASILRSRMSKIIRGIKVVSGVRDLGCSIEFLKQYLESKFTNGMTWENYGFYGWHIDHIIPLGSVNLTDREEMLKVCHYTNLQPLWAIDNLKKSKR